MRFPAAFLVSIVSLLGQARTTHEVFRAEAAAAHERKDYTAAREAMLAALALLPDSPHYLHHLAALSALLNDRDAALGYLHQIASLGVAPRIERDSDLAALQGTPEFMRVLHTFEANRAPRGEGEIVAELPGRTGVIEGIAFRERTGDLFLGDVHHRCIWRRDRDGRVARYTVEDDELLGVFALALDEPRNTLWAAMSAVPEMLGYEAGMKGQAALAEFDLSTSELRRVIPVPADGRDHGLSDLTVAPDGTVYATDTKSPVIWLLAPDAEELQKAADSPVFGSLQGIVLEKRLLLVADHMNGLFTVEVATGNITALSPPRNVTLVGLDGIVVVPGGIVAVQNGVEPQRIVRVTLSSGLDAITGVEVIAAALPNLTDLSLITMANDRPTVVAGAGWAGLERAGTRPPAPHAVRIFQLTLP
ncbi:MAG: hypothetical protein ACREH8_09495 [Opitutaceae bacterium]